MRAEEYLSQIQKFDCIIQNKFDEKEQWLAMASSITSQMGTERVQSSGSKQRMSDAVIESIDIGEQITKEINSLMKKRSEIIHTIELLDVQDYQILYMVYVGKVKYGKDGRMITEYSNLKDVADKFFKTYGWATDNHRKAIRALQKILDEREKPRD